ncbi:hypothetical protein, partial [Sutterella sp.]|uniref:hypothetical protein n=1 Tax=Sutterella sp. TaxID=1981025 RepID=UPI0026E10466
NFSFDLESVLPDVNSARQNLRVFPVLQVIQMRVRFVPWWREIRRGHKNKTNMSRAFRQII